MTPTPATSVTSATGVDGVSEKDGQTDAHSAAASTSSLSLTPATPLPWKLDEYRNVYFGAHRHDRVTLEGFALRAGGYRPEPEQNTEYAVHACNAYPKLVDALQQAVLQIAYMQSKFTATGTGNAVIAQSEALLRELGQGTPQENAEAK
jgi:hypothetical protein